MASTRSQLSHKWTAAAASRVYEIKRRCNWASLHAPSQCFNLLVHAGMQRASLHEQKTGMQHTVKHSCQRPRGTMLQGGLKTGSCWLQDADSATAAGASNLRGMQEVGCALLHVHKSSIRPAWPSSAQLRLLLERLRALPDMRGMTQALLSVQGARLEHAAPPSKTT